MYQREHERVFTLPFNMDKLKLHKPIAYFKMLTTAYPEARKKHAVARVMESRPAMHNMASWDDSQ